MRRKINKYDFKTFDQAIKTAIKKRLSMNQVADQINIALGIPILFFR